MGTVDASWVNDPPTNENVADLPADILDTRAEIVNRVAKEHETYQSGTNGSTAPDGWHLPGSTKDYFQASAPTKRPDGTTTLDADDAGRKWVNSSTYQVKVWNGSTWHVITL